MILRPNKQMSGYVESNASGTYVKKGFSNGRMEWRMLTWELPFELQIHFFIEQTNTFIHCVLLFRVYAPVSTEQ